MATDRKKTGGALWAKLMVLSLLLYVASIGPLVLLDNKDLIPTGLRGILSIIYTPVTWLYDDGPAPLGTIVRWYVDLWEP